ncbi:MAG TPA: SGNH/GDSL hydrolase family protein, partial [Acidimicrobiales bacterium]|nr:SGNH/GDSL hydrolase family protein [Acidimicrobiales bacterium]
VASTGKAVVPGAAGAGLLVLGLMAMSAGWPPLGLRPFTGAWALAFGLVVVFIGGVITAATLNAPLLAAAGIAALVAVVGGSFVWRGEALVAAVLVGMAFVWLTVDRVDRVGVDPHPEAAQRILALGDSYISGEGAPNFFDGTNVRGPDENECRRAVTAYPYLVADDLQMGLDFYACSGAKADQLWERGQAPTKSPDDIPGEKPQLQNLPADVSKIRVVVVSIGGNDAQFSDIGKGCVLPGTCDALRDVWMTNLDQITNKVARAYEEIKARLPNVPIVAMPYPLMLQDHSCSWSRLDGREHAFISEFVVVLNDRVRVAAEKAGVNFFDQGMLAFEGAKICDGDSGKDTVMNFLAANPVQGSFLQRINPKNWIHGSLHPKPAGHARTAKVLGPWLKTLLDDVAAGRRPPNRQPNPAAQFTFRNVRGVTPALLADDDRPRDVPCLAKGETIDPFAGRVRLFDETSPLPVPALLTAPVCFQAADGTWQTATPSAQNPAARLADGVVYVQPIAPLRGRTQQVVFRGLDNRWQLRFVDFCSRDATCPTSSDDFQNEQLGRAAQVAVPPLLILLLGGWLFAMGTTRRAA